MADRKRNTAPQDLGELPGYLLYARVSTKRQDEKQLSIPDQCAQIHVHIAALNGEVVGEYREARTATDNKRPQFQAMVERACNGGERIVGIAVHSFSRFMRDAHQFETYARRLSEHGVIEITLWGPLPRGKGRPALVPAAKWRRRRAHRPA